jgi:hypothetical protein
VLEETGRLFVFLFLDFHPRVGPFIHVCDQLQRPLLFPSSVRESQAADGDADGSQR